MKWFLKMLLTIDNEWNGLETQKKALMLLTPHPWYGLTHAFLGDPYNFTLDIFQDFVWNITFETSSGYNKPKKTAILVFLSTTEISQLHAAVHVMSNFRLKNVFKKFDSMIFGFVFSPATVWKVDSSFHNSVFVWNKSILGSSEMWFRVKLQCSK